MSNELARMHQAQDQGQRAINARIRLINDVPEIGGPSMRLTIREDPSVEMWQTDGTYLDYNPEYTRQFKLPELVGLLAHETFHCLRGDMFRMGDRDPEVWNDATDATAQAALRDSGLFQLPPNKMDPRIDEFRGESSEVVYAVLYKEKQEQEQNGGGQQPGDDGSVPYPTIVPAPEGNGIGKDGKPEQRLTAEDWRIMGAQAQMIGQKRGTMPGSMVESISLSRQAQPDWVAELREFVANTVETDVSWTHPNRRFLGMNPPLYLPGPIKENTARILLAIDSSGSVSTPLLNVFLWQVPAILQQTQPEALDVLVCDSAIHGDVQTFYPGDDFDPEVKIGGRGGTAFTPVFDWLKHQQEYENVNYGCIIYLTDLDGDRPAEPDIPTLWVVPQHVRRTGLFGRTIRIPPVR